MTDENSGCSLCYKHFDCECANKPSPDEYEAIIREKDEQIFKLENRLKECENGYDGTLHLERCKIAEKDAEIERLKSHINRLKKYDEERDIRLHARLTENARAEAISEFANLFDKAVSNTFVHYGWYIKQIIIPEIAKKMRGEQT